MKLDKHLKKLKSPMILSSKVEVNKLFSVKHQIINSGLLSHTVSILTCAKLCCNSRKVATYTCD